MSRLSSLTRGAWRSNKPLYPEIHLQDLPTIGRDMRLADSSIPIH